LKKPLFLTNSAIVVTNGIDVHVKKFFYIFLFFSEIFITFAA